VKRLASVAIVSASRWLRKCAPVLFIKLTVAMEVGLTAAAIEVLATSARALAREAASRVRPATPCLHLKCGEYHRLTDGVQIRAARCPIKCAAGATMIGREPPAAGIRNWPAQSRDFPSPCASYQAGTQAGRASPQPLQWSVRHNGPPSSEPGLDSQRTGEIHRLAADMQNIELADRRRGVPPDQRFHQAM